VTLEQEASRHRASLAHVVVIAVTGSCGKTTTKDLIARVLAGRYRGSASSGSFNCGTDLARDLLTVSREDEFFVQELAAWGPGTMEPGLDLLRPQIGVVTNLRNDHYSAFHGPRGAQAEKGKLVRRLPPSGTAVLNWDDPLVRELADGTRARVLRFGRSSEAELRAIEVSSRWPDRLSFDLLHRGQRTRVRTRLLGEHLLGSVLAAMAVGLVLDVPLLDAVAAVEAAQPTPRRMSVVTLPDDVTFVRDDFKAPADSLPEVLRFLADADANRTVAVIGRISDYPGRSRPAYSGIARIAVTTADVVLFVGARAVALWGRAESTGDQARLHAAIGLGPGFLAAPMYVLDTVQRAAAFLADILSAGDLVLLKGSGPVDHLERILLDREHAVGCWLTDCRRVISCDDCSLLRPGLIVWPGPLEGHAVDHLGDGVLGG